MAAMAVGCTGGPAPQPSATFPQVRPPLAVSGTSPFHGCPDRTDFRLGLDSEVEPSLAVDPDHAGHLLVAWQQDRNFKGGALALMTATSDDGGRTFSAARPAVTTCAGGPYELASDPAVSIGPDRAYLAAIGIHAGAGGGEESDLDADVVVSSSADGGLTWGAPVVAGTSSDPLVALDKETVVADPSKPGTALVAWVQYTSSAPDRAANTNQTFVSRTSDGGITWSTPMLSYDGGSETQFHQLVVLPGGAIVDAFIEAPTLSERPPIPAQLRVVRSEDGGATWSPAVTAAQVMFTAVVDPTGKDQVRGTGQGILAAAGPDGALYICWAEQHPQSESFLSVVRSDDGGATWSEPTRVVSTRSGQPFVPQIAVAGDGRPGVTWYQVTGDAAGGRLSTEAWLAWSDDQGASWQSLRLAGPFDLHTAELSEGGDFVGDYEGLVGLPGGFAAVNALAGPISRAGPTDIFFSVVDLGP
jgi:hypothetical protein